MVAAVKIMRQISLTLPAIFVNRIFVDFSKRTLPGFPRQGALFCVYVR